MPSRNKIGTSLVRAIADWAHRKFYSEGNLSGFLGIGSATRQEMQLNRGWAYAGINVISEAIANIDFIAYKRQADGTVSEVEDHALLDLLDGVNPHMTGFELKMRIAQHLELAGNAYLLLLNAQGAPVKSDNDVPAMIYPLIPSKVQPDRGKWPELVKGFKYTRMDGTDYYYPHQIVHIKYPNPSDDVLGLSPMAGLSSWIQTEEAASDFQRIFFMQGTKVGGVLKTTRNLNRETIELLRSQWHEMQQGLRNAHNPVILPDYVEYTDNTRPPMELDFVNSLNEMRDKILAGMRVPKTLLGNAEGSTNRATAETATYVFSLYTIKPKMQLITAYLNEYLVPRFDPDLFLGFHDPVPENRDAEILELKEAMAGQATLTINESRQRFFGLPPVKGGDVIMAPITDVAVGGGEETPAPPQKGAPDNSFGPTKQIKAGRKAVVQRKGKSRGQRLAESRKAMSTAIAKAALDKFKSLPRKPLKEYTREEYQLVWEQKIARVTPFEDKLKDVFLKANGKMRTEALNNLTSVVKDAVRRKAVDPNKLVDKSKVVKIIVDGATPVQTALYQQEAKTSAEQIGAQDVLPFTPAAKDALDASIGKMADTYTSTTLDSLKTQLDTGLEQGLGIADLTDVLNGVFDFADETRAAAIARTETTRTANAAKEDAWAQSGIVGTKVWFTAEDEKVCPYCSTMDGKEIDLGSSFLGLGDSIDGSDGSSLTADYSSVGGPPLHPNCRCDLIPGDINS